MEKSVLWIRRVPESLKVVDQCEPRSATLLVSGKIIKEELLLLKNPISHQPVWHLAQYVEQFSGVSGPRHIARLHRREENLELPDRDRVAS